MILDANGLTTLRSHPHGTKLYLSVFEPSTLVSARVTGSVSIGDMNVSLYDVSGSGIYSGSTAMIGSEAGKDDIGRIRVRTISGSVVGVAENAIDWAVGQYITVINQVDVNAIFPRIIQNPSNPEDVIFFKDWDIAYSNQNSIMGTLVCMGSHYAGFLENGSHDVYYTATGTVNVNDSALTYLWSFEGGTPTGSTAHTPGNVSYDTPGHYVTKLITTSAQGAVDVSYRYISIYDKPGEGDNTPILNWSLQDFSGSRSEGGYTLSMIVRENIDQIQPNAVVVIFSDEFYGSTNGSLGGNQPNRESIKFVGYVLDDSITYNYKTSEVTFRVGSITEVMKQAEGFSVSVEAKASPTTWFEIQDMGVLKALYHYIKWHSTVNLVADVQFPETDRKVQYFDADRTSLYDAIYSLMSVGLLGSAVADRQGKLWLEIEPKGLSNPLSKPTAMSILKQDWLGSPSIRENRSQKTSFVELGGIAYSGTSTGTFSAHLSNAPSETPLYRGSHRDEKGLIITGQDQLNAISGNLLAMENSRFPEIEFEMNGNYSNLDIAPIEFVQPFIASEDTFRNVRIQNEKYEIERMDWFYDAGKGVFKPGINVKHVTTGSAGVTIEIPDIPDDSGFSVPNFQIPSIPLSSFPTNIGSTATGSSCCDYIAGVNGLGLGLGVYSIVATRDVNILTTTFVADERRFYGWEFVSNPSMYDASNGKINFLNTGTYSWEVGFSFDWTVTQNDEPSDSIAWTTIAIQSRLYDSGGVYAGESFGDTIYQRTYYPVGYTEHFVQSNTYNPSNPFPNLFKSPYYFALSIYFAERNPPHVFNLSVSNMRFYLRNSP